MAWEIVGVVDDVRIEDVQEEPLIVLYMPTVVGTPDQPEATHSLDVVVASAGDPLSRIDAVREATRAVDPRMPIIQPRTLQSVVDESLGAASFAAVLLGISAAVALLLGTVGIYGVVSYTVSRRTKEIGVRLALGAAQGTVLGAVLKQGMALTLVGLGVGLLGALGLSTVLESLLYGVSTRDPLTFGATALVLGVVAVVATLIPARRAARVDPVVALRTE